MRASTLDPHPLRRRWRFMRRTYLLELSNALEYRGALIGWVILGGAPLLASYVVWKLVFESTPDALLVGYSFSMLITYQFLATLLFQLNTPWSLQSAITTEIRNGEISRYMIRPIPYRLYRWIRYLGYNTIFFSLLVGPAALVLWMLGDDFLFTGMTQTGLAVVAALLGFAIQFFAVMTFAFVAFWFDEVGWLFFAYTFLSRFCAGELVPLEMLPDGLREGIMYTPFPQMAWVPLQLYLGRVEAGDVVPVLLTSVGWIAVLWVASGLLWKIGIRRYSAFGG